MIGLELEAGIASATAAMVVLAIGTVLRRRRGGSPGTADAVAPELAAPGVALGWPFRRRGGESLRIQPAGDDFHVIWRHGDRAIAHFVVADEGVARGLYAWAGERFGTVAGSEGVAASAPSRERVVARVRQRRPRREVALIAGGAAPMRVVDVADGRVRSAALVADEEDGRELLALLTDPLRARELADRPSAAIVPAPPRVTGASPLASRAAPAREPATRC